MCRFQLIIFISAIEGDFIVGVIRVVGILIGVVISLVCNICVMPVSAERCLNEVRVVHIISHVSLRRMKE